METLEIRIAKFTYSQEQLDFIQNCISEYNPDKIIKYRNDHYEEFIEIQNQIMELASKLNQLELFTFFVEKLGFDLDTDYQLFITACHNNSLDIINYLLSQNANVKMLNHSPFYIASKNGYLDMLKLFFEHANVCPETNNNEFIIIAGQYNRFDVIEYLISLGANPYARNNLLVKTACEYNNLPLLKFFVESGLSITKDVRYCIDICIAFDFSEIIVYYLQNSFFCPSSENFSQFFTCIETDNVNVFNIFFEHCYHNRIEISKEILHDLLQESDSIKEDSLCSLFIREKLGLGFECEFPSDFPLAVECHVCLEDSNLILPCRHTICSRCLIFLYKTKTCGICRLPFDKSYIKRKTNQN